MVYFIDIDVDASTTTPPSARPDSATPKSAPTLQSVSPRGSPPAMIDDRRPRAVTTSNTPPSNKRKRSLVIYISLLTMYLILVQFVFASSKLLTKNE